MIGPGERRRQGGWAFIFCVSFYFAQRQERGRESDCCDDERGAAKGKGIMI
jgi:hypothetical protein